MTTTRRKIADLKYITGNVSYSIKYGHNANFQKIDWMPIDTINRSNV